MKAEHQTILKVRVHKKKKKSRVWLVRLTALCFDANNPTSVSPLLHIFKFEEVAFFFYLRILAIDALDIYKILCS